MTPGWLDSHWHLQSTDKAPTLKWDLTSLTSLKSRNQGSEMKWQNISCGLYKIWEHEITGKRQRSGKSSVERSNPGLSFRLFQICFVDAKFSATGTSEQHSDMWHSSKGWQKAWRSILTNYCRGILIYFEQHSDIDTLPPCCTTFQNLNLVATWSLESASVWNLENQNQNHNIYIHNCMVFILEGSPHLQVKLAISPFECSDTSCRLTFFFNTVLGGFFQICCISGPWISEHVSLMFFLSPLFTILETSLLAAHIDGDSSW